MEFFFKMFQATVSATFPEMGSMLTFHIQALHSRGRAGGQEDCLLPQSFLSACPFFEEPFKCAIFERSNQNVHENQYYTQVR